MPFLNSRPKVLLIQKKEQNACVASTSLTDRAMPCSLLTVLRTEFYLASLLATALRMYYLSHKLKKEHELSTGRGRKDYSSSGYGMCKVPMAGRTGLNAQCRCWGLNALDGLTPAFGHPWPMPTCLFYCRWSHTDPRQGEAQRASPLDEAENVFMETLLSYLSGMVGYF